MIKKWFKYFTSSPEKEVQLLGWTIFSGMIIFFILLCTGVVVVH